MKPKRVLSAVVIPVLLVAGCVDQNFFVKQGVSYDRYERDYVGCSTQAAQKVPVNTQVGWMPYVGVYSADTNTALRLKNFELCMRDKGYQEVQIPYCSGSDATTAMERAKSRQDRNRQMRITPRSCYVQGPSGRPHLYSPD